MNEHWLRLGKDRRLPIDRWEDFLGRTEMHVDLGSPWVMASLGSKC